MTMRHPIGPRLNTVACGDIDYRSTFAADAIAALVAIHGEPMLGSWQATSVSNGHPVQWGCTLADGQKMLFGVGRGMRGRDWVQVGTQQWAKVGQNWHNRSNGFLGKAKLVA